MKATKSKDGYRRFTFVIKFRAGAPEIEFALFDLTGWYFQYPTEDEFDQLLDALEEQSRAKVLERTRVNFELGSSPEGADYYAMRDDVQAAVRDRAEILFPELYTKGASDGEVEAD